MFCVVYNVFYGACMFIVKRNINMSKMLVERGQPCVLQSMHYAILFEWYSHLRCHIMADPLDGIKIVQRFVFFDNAKKTVYALHLLL
jgi:hypothetical protein